MIDYNGYNETELITLLQGGDERALRPLYDTYVKQLHYFILRTAKSKELAQDIVHDVFIKIWENRLQIDAEQPFKPYLYAIAKRHLLNVLKRAQHESHIYEAISKYATPFENTTEMHVDYQESNALFSEAVNQLPAQCREVFVRCKIQGLSYKQAADELGITEGTVNSQMVKALRSIKQFINVRNAFSLILIYIKLIN